MTSNEMKLLIEKQKKKTLPSKLFVTFNILVSFTLAVYMIVLSVQESCSGQFEQKIVLQVLPEALNEAGEKPGDTKSDQESKEDDDDTPANQPLDDKQKKWNETFQIYAQKITIKNTNLIHEMNFDIAPKTDLPLNSGDVDIAFEVYDKDKEYLFTFYGNYWNEDGYDEGEYWHERNYYDSAYLKFPYEGDYYIVAGIPAGNPAMFEKITRSSENKVNLVLMSNSKPFPVSAVFGCVFFVTFGIILITTRRFFFGGSRFYPYNLIYTNPDFNNNHFIIEIEGNHYYINGITRDPIKKNSTELVLDRDGQASFLEIEREYDDGEIEYYSTFYDSFPEDDFKEIPKQSEIVYQNRSFKSPSLKAAPKKIETLYANGLKEETQKTEIYFESMDENPYIISFEYDENPGDFDISFGRPIQLFKIWRIKK